MFWKPTFIFRKPKGNIVDEQNVKKMAECLHRNRFQEFLVYSLRLIVFKKRFRLAVLQQQFWTCSPRVGGSFGNLRGVIVRFRTFRRISGGPEVDFVGSRSLGFEGTRSGGFSGASK